MKKNLLIPTLLTIGSAPLVSLVGCDKHEYIDVELKNNPSTMAEESDVMTFEEGKYYRFYWNTHANEVWYCNFGFYNNVYPPTDRKLNVDVIKVVVDKKVVTYEETSEDDQWYITFPISSSSTLLEIYIKVNETKENFVAFVDD